MTKRTKYFVLNGETLGYIQPSSPLFGILAGSIRGIDWKRGPVALCPGDTLTPATQADFDRFRVDSKNRL